MRKLFGTDGVRGVANLEPMTSEIAMQLGRAAAHIFMRRAGRHQVVIGKDTRLSGYMLESALTSGICSMGVDVLLVGPMPTPAIAFLTRSLRADAGVVISASHNPYQDNGIKFFSNQGFKLPDEVEARIEQLIVSDEIKHLRPTADAIGKAYRIGDAEGRYIEFVKRSLPRDLDFQGIKLVVDCANGAAYKVAPSVLRELGATIEVFGDKPDGMNINDRCGAVHPERLQELVWEHQADLGIALDGDADRAIFVCEQGKVVDGDHVMAALGLDLFAQGQLANKTVVGTVMSNFGLELAMNKAGIQLARTPVGDRYLLERMLADGHNFGGEQSGHFIFLDHNTTGDGLISALQILSLMKRTGKPLSELAKAMTAVPQVLLNVHVKHKPDLDQIPDIQSAIRTAESTLNGSGRVLVRYSGTEPLLRIMVEGERDVMIREVADHLAQVVRARIG
ncbi:phosphoglucosamine mutase [Nitrospirales bacterium NOB]|nr:Phosphoglucosamine mutase [Nitrospirota bacterium]MCE7964751.1 phosphoglucosamine mutase [Nitrospira sp. NTP2]MCK6492502.1 phosphoglucosamine mutase [Nitrospira sp.]MDL1888178.1 phosphoglucosamine mutase [Nitrospirales bacterium NOB]MEB2337829.1 phosphoglucosamine mutase [Nitrospirales bacterium]